MKKNLFLLMGLFLFSTLSAQTYFEETFDTQIPATWQNIDNTTNGGGVWEWLDNQGAGIALFNSDGYGNDGLAEDADLITPMFDCTTGTDVYLNIDGFFRQYASSVGTVSASNDGGTTWTVMETVNTTSGALYSNISAVAAGNDSVMLKFNYVGNWDYFWVFDAIKVYTPDAIDAAIFSIDNEEYVDIAGSASLTGVIQNLGLNPLTSFDLNYSVGGGPLVTENVSGVNVALGDFYTYTHGTAWAPSSVGLENVVVSVTNVNAGTDADMTNNSIDKDFTVYTMDLPNGAVRRAPLFEIFTSSTCGPCAPGNANFHSIVDSKPAEEFVGIKFQQDFPSTGDPYATSESIARRNYYGVNSIPRMEIDGGWDDNAASFTDNLYNFSRSKPSYLELSATYHVDQTTKKVTVNVSGKSLQDYAAGNYRLQVAILENVTTANVKTNGETEFENLTKKMMPNENGTAISALTLDYEIDETLEYTFAGDYRLPTNGQAANQINLATEHSVEDFEDLSVVLWVEEATAKTVLQAAHAKVDSDNDGFSDEEELAAGSDPNDANGNPNNVSIKDVENITLFNVFPNPSTDFVNVEIQSNNSKTISVELIDVLGRTIETVEVENNMASFNVSKLNKGIYLVNAKIDGKSIATSSVVVR